MSGNKYDDFIEYSITKLSNLIKNKEISPIEIVTELISKIKQDNKVSNAYITIMEQEALKQSKKVKQEIMNNNYKGSLHGIPIGLKDVFYTKYIKTTFGSNNYRNFIPDFDAEVVTKLKNAGAIIIGKLNTHQFCLGNTGDVSFFGPSRNPHNLNEITGG